MKKILIIVFVMAALSTSTLAQVAVTFKVPTYGFNVIPGSVRTYSVGITGGTGNLVNWSVTGTTGGASATLSASTNALPVVTATFGATAGTCTINGSLGSYSVTSTATVTIRAQSVDDITKTSSTTVNVCNPAVQIAIIPFYRTLYASQKADLQSYIIGSTNLGVTWSITSQPGGGNGVLSDTGNRDTVFSATVAGRYTLTATSSADGTKTATAIMFVTGNAQPYSITPEFTEPVDCTADPSSTGTVYEVGPARAFTTIQSVPMNTMVAGSTVRIHNDDLTGTSPTTYHEYFQITSKLGTPSQPLRVVGCSDSLGNLPIVDGSNATGASWVSAFSAAGYGIASIAGPVYGYYQAGNPTNANDIIEGLHLKHASPSYTYTTPAGVSGTPWVAGASCTNIRSGYNLVILGNDIDTCSNGTFSDANTDNNEWLGQVLWTLWEGNHIHGSGINGQFSYHQLYIQGWGQLIQFNRIDNPIAGMQGANLKSRAIGDVIRYNYLGPAPARETDLVDLQDSSNYSTFEDYLSIIGQTNCNFSTYCLGDTMGPNILAAWQEAYHQTFMYGNIFNNTGGASIFMHHFSEDTVGSMGDRTGFLYFYYNTNVLAGVIQQALFDTSGGSSDFINYEFPVVVAANNIVWAPSNVPYWNKVATLIATFQTNLLNTGWGNITTPINGGSINGLTGNGWSNLTNSFSYPLAVPLNTHLTGLSAGNFLTTGTQPFDSSTYIPPVGSAARGAATALTGAMAVMPVRFQMRPDTGVVTMRANVNDIGALAATTSTVPSVTIGNGTTLYNGATIQ